MVPKRLQGRFDHVLDDKSRVIVPMRWREVLGDRLILCRSFDGSASIWGFAEEEFNRLYDLFEDGVGMGDLEGQRQLRLLSASVTEAEIDKQGRLLVPAQLRDFAVIPGAKGAQLMLLGSKDRFEIWSPEQFEKHTAGVDMSTLPAKAEKARVDKVG
ncbi:MAG: division/cell wall cluster transcriptional repressor MraZ [Candidatus Xenobia bacterium]